MTYTYEDVGDSVLADSLFYEQCQLENWAGTTPGLLAFPVPWENYLALHLDAENISNEYIQFD